MASAFGSRLRRFREAKKWAFAKSPTRSACTKAYIWELEMKEGQRPSAERVQALARVLGVTMEDVSMGGPMPQVHRASPEDVAFFRAYAGMTRLRRTGRQPWSIFPRTRICRKARWSRAPGPQRRDRRQQSPPLVAGLGMARTYREHRSRCRAADAADRLHGRGSGKFVPRCSSTTMPSRACWRGDPGDPGRVIAYNGLIGPQRQRFTIAHELGHFVLHRDRQQRFNCDKESVYSGHGRCADRREAGQSFQQLADAGDRLREWISNGRIDLHVLSIAKRFQVSFEARTSSFIKFTPQRAILVYWDSSYAYEWRSSSAVRTRAHPAQRRSAGTAAGRAGRRRQRRSKMGWHGDVAAILVPGGGTAHEAAEFKHSWRA